MALICRRHTQFFMNPRRNSNSGDNMNSSPGQVVSSASVWLKSQMLERDGSVIFFWYASGGNRHT